MLPNKKNATKKLFLDFGLFWSLFNQKTAKIDKKWSKLAKYKPFDEIFWNLVCRCFPTKKMLQKLFFEFGLFWPFFNQKIAKIDKKWRKLAKYKPFDEIFWNLVCSCFPTKEMLQNYFFWILAFFGHFLTETQPKLTKNKKICKIQTVWWNFMKFGM